MTTTPTDTPVPSRSESSGSSRSVRGVGLALCLPPMGVFGAHRFYSGKIGTGILQAITFGGMGVWWLYDMILVATGEFRDADGRRISAWSRNSPPGKATAA